MHGFYAFIMLVEKDQADFPAQWKNHLNRTVVLGAHREMAVKRKLDAMQLAEIESNREAAKRRRTLKRLGRNYVAGGGPGKVITKSYVQRSPGGQIVADNHYFDGQTIQTGLPINPITISWAGCEADAYSGAGTGTLSMNCLFAPLMGDDIQNRQGRKVFVQTIRIRGYISIPPQATQATADSACRVRLILYHDKQTNAASTGSENVIGSGYQVPVLEQFQNLLNIGRFNVLKDKSFLLQRPSIANDTGATGGLVQSGLKQLFKFTVKPNMWVNYNATNGGTVADVIDNSWHMIAAADTGGGVNMTPTLYYKVRTVFKA